MTNLFNSSIKVSEFEQEFANKLFKSASFEEELKIKETNNKFNSLVNNLKQASAIFNGLNWSRTAEVIDDLIIKIAIKKFEPVKILIYTPSETDPDRLRDVGEDIRHYGSFKEGIEYALRENGVIDFQIWEKNKRKRTPGLGWAINPKEMSVDEAVKTLYDGLEENAWRFEDIGEKWQDHFKP